MGKVVVAIVGVPLALLLAVGVIASGGDGPDPVAVGPVNAAAASIPQVFLSAYQLGASACPGLSWQVLAGIGWVESRHGEDRVVGADGDVLPAIVGPAIDGRAGFARIFDAQSPDGWAHARGPMQFLTTTWRGIARLGPTRPPGAKPSIDNVFDAAETAAAYLCANAPSVGELSTAIKRYNHSDAYVRQVLAKAAEYGFGAESPAAASNGMTCPVAGPVSHSRDWHAARSGGREHQGNDVFGALGTTLVAIEAGTIDKQSNVDAGLATSEEDQGEAVHVVWTLHCLGQASIAFAGHGPQSGDLEAESEEHDRVAGFMVGRDHRRGDARAGEELLDVVTGAGDQRELELRVGRAHR